MKERVPRGAAAAVALDQLGFAGAHLAFQLLLARWLAPAEHGLFAQIQALLLVGLALHSAFVSEPLLVHGRRSFEPTFERYLGVVLLGHAVVSGVFAMLLAPVLTLSPGVGGLREPGVLVAIGAPVLFLVPLLRRACAVRMAWLVAAGGGVVYAAGLLGALGLARGAGALSVKDAVGCLLLASALSVVAIGLGTGWRPVRLEAGFAREVARRHWAYGRWALLAVLATWVPWNLHYLVLAPRLGLEQIGGLRALQNLVLPISHLSMALCTALLPVIAAHLARGRVATARLLARRQLAGLAAANLGYVGLIAWLGDDLLRLVYGVTYAELHPLAVPVVASQALWSAIAALALAQQALGRSGRVLLLWLPYVGLSLLLGVAGALLADAEGFVVGMLLAAVLALPAAWALHHAWRPWAAPA